MNSVLITLVATAASFLVVEPGVFRSGDELVVRIDTLERLRLQHPQLSGQLRVHGAGGEKVFPVDLSDSVTSAALIVDLTGYGDCSAVSLTVKNASGQVVHSQQVQPVPQVTIPRHPALTANKHAAIERGSQWNGALPQIELPDVTKVRKLKLQPAARSVTSAEITYPVIADADLPAVSSNNAVLVSRQSFAPDDATRCSLYFSYRKGLFDPQTAQLTGYRKMLIEVPLDRRWLDGSGDETITLPNDGFAIHTTEDLEQFGKRWNAPQGYNMLGESSTGLYQGGQTCEVDDQGRIYISNVPDGAGLIRFNPHTARFEQPPLNFHDAIAELLPSDGDWKRSWDRDLGQVVCTRGRVYIVFDRNYRVITSNGKFETCSGVISVPQDGWDDSAKFKSDIRLHAACWPTAKHALYQDEVPVGAPRRAGSPIATTTGIAFGTFRLDLDDHGNTARLAVIKTLTDATAADGSSLPPTQPALMHGLPRQRYINVGGAGRAFLKFAYGEFTISRAALGLTLPGATAAQLADSAGKHRSTYDGAPSGELTIRFDIAGKIKAEPTRYPRLAAALSGVSQGPNYGVLPLPGQADAALGVCEYSYYFSRLDFSRRSTDRKVYRSYLPLLSSGRATNLPIQVGLGPYNLEWIEQSGVTWLYSAGYTGLGRMKYAEQGRTLDAYVQEPFHARLAPRPIDGRGRDAVKDYLHVLPALDGRLINIGRGRPGRGGGAYSAGLELFDPRTFGKSETAVVMNRCFGLYTPVSRVVWSAAGQPTRQEVYCATGDIRPEYVADIDNPAERPQNQEPKLLAYDVTAGGSLADRFGFALPELATGSSAASVVFSPCRQFLVALQAGGALHTYSVAQRRFVDSVQLRTPADTPIQPLDRSRPSSIMWSAPNGQSFFATALDGPQSQSVTYYRVTVSHVGQLDVQPQLTVRWSGAGNVQDFADIVQCLLPDLRRHDGSYDLVLGGSNANGGQPTVRVIDDFISAAKR